jgi:TrwC relaxase
LRRAEIAGSAGPADCRQRLRLGLHLAVMREDRDRTAGGYYLNASLQGEAPGRWFGRGVQALGLAGEVQRCAYDDVYGQHDPRTGARLG